MIHIHTFASQRRDAVHFGAGTDRHQLPNWKLIHRHTFARMTQHCGSLRSRSHSRQAAPHSPVARLPGHAAGRPGRAAGRPGRATGRPGRATGRLPVARTKVEDILNATCLHILCIIILCRRPYRVECTGSLPTSEVKRRRAQLVLGWGTAREHLRVLSAFECYFCSLGCIHYVRALRMRVTCART